MTQEVGALLFLGKLAFEIRSSLKKDYIKCTFPLVGIHFLLFSSFVHTCASQQPLCRYVGEQPTLERVEQFSCLRLYSHRSC